MPGGTQSHDATIQITLRTPNTVPKEFECVMFGETVLSYSLSILAPDRSRHLVLTELIHMELMNRETSDGHQSKRRREIKSDLNMLLIHVQAAESQLRKLLKTWE